MNHRHFPIRALSSSCIQKKYVLKMTCLFPLILLLALSAGTPGFSADESLQTPDKVIFLPFTIATDKPRQYLKNGLTEVLVSRVANRAGITAVHKNNATREIARLMEQGDQNALKNMLTDMQADHLIIGSLERQKTDFELLIYLFSKNRPVPATFSKTISSLGEAIPALDDLSIDIADQILHKTNNKKKTKTAFDTGGTSAFQTAHPDRAFKEGLYTHAAGTSTVGADSLADKTIAAQAKTPIETDAIALAAGDINNDSLEEIILLGHGNLAIYHLAAGKFQHIADYPLASYLSPHAINLGDFNNNGLQEMYISANSGNRPTSLILEWDGSTFHTLEKSVPFYLRPGLNAKGERILIGQKGSSITPVSPYFYQLTLNKEGQIEEQEKLNVPDGFNLFDFIRLDLNQDGNMEIAGLRQNDQLVILDQEGNRVWESDVAYGASKTFLGDVTRDRAGDRTLLYMHSRLIARDINGDGRPEIIIGQNRASTINYFKQLRFFKGTSIKALQWNGSGFTTLWETPLSRRYTVDYQLSNTTTQHATTRVYSLENKNNSPLFFWKAEGTTLQYLDMK
ncbi:MAG: hypothetical protein DSY70_08010 [Desulfobulbus sp.]|nr:MAG: hypothetical protein DSY70_08010 [Desulfobulbus sp.]